MKQNLILPISWLLVIALLLVPLQGALAAMPGSAISPMTEVAMADMHAEHSMGEREHVECQHCGDDPQALNHGSHNCHDENGNCLSMSHCMFGLVSFENLSNTDFSTPSYRRYSVALHTIDLSSEIEPPRA